MKKAAGDKKASGSGAKSASKGGSSLNAASLTVGLAKRDEERMEMSLEDIRRRLWRAMPTVAAVVLEREPEDTQTSHPPASSHGAGEDEALRAADPTDTMSVPWTDMQATVRCLFLATHANPTPEDTEAAVASIVGTAEAPIQPMYTQSDLFSFLDTVPERWLPHYGPTRNTTLTAAEAVANPNAVRALKLLNSELIDCVTTDEAPFHLLKAEEVLMLSNHHPTNPLLPKAANLRTPVEGFVALTKHRRYPAVFDHLWDMLRQDEAPDVEPDAEATVTEEQFAVFVVWFSALHFTNTTETRSRAAAQVVYNEFLNAQGRFSMDSFQRACAALCRRYGQRRDTADYLKELLARTAAASGVTGDLGSLSLSHVDEKKLEEQAPRTVLADPERLYLPDELRPWVHDEDILAAGPTRNRLVVYGGRALGKTMVGRALASHLNCVHLDVLELAVQAVLNAAASDAADATGEDTAPNSEDEEAGANPAGDGEGEITEKFRARNVNQDVLKCMEDGTPIPLSVQAALIRRELSKSAASEFQGFIFSDTMDPLSSATSRDAYNAFIQSAGLTDVAVPAVFVELVSHNAEVHAARVGEAAAAFNAQLATVQAKEQEETEKVRLELEAREMRASCQEIIDNFAQLKKATPGSVPAGELAAAENQAAEARDILEQLDAEKAESERLQMEKQDNPDQDSEAALTEEEKEAKGRQQLEVVLRHLLEQGRAVLSVEERETGTEVEDSQAGRLAAAVPCWAASVASAQLLHRVLSVDASSPVPDIVKYVTDTLSLQPTPLPHSPLTTAGAPISADDSAASAYDAAVASGDEEEAGRVLEAAAAEKGYSLSPAYKRFCPVTYEEDGVLVEGAACFMAVYRDCQYLFASRAKLARFMANPVPYLKPKQAVSDKQRVLLVAGDSLKGRWSSTEAFADSDVVTRLADALQLTPLSLPKYAECVEEYCDLRNRRSAVAAARREYEAAELQQRDERLEKRFKADTKKKKPANPSKPKVRKPTGPTHTPTVAIIEPPSQTGKGKHTAAASPVDPLSIPTATEEDLQRRIAEAKARLKDTVPVLVVMAAWEHAKELNASIDMLLKERSMPERVVVLERTLDKNGAAAFVASTAFSSDDNDREEDANEAEGEESVKALLERLAKAEAAAPRAGAAAAWKRKEGENALPPQSFTTHILECVEDPSVTITGHTPVVRAAVKELETDAITVRRVLQTICPGAPTVSDAVVDEELGMYDDEDEEEEEEGYEDNGYDDPDGNDGTSATAKALELGAEPREAPVDPKLKPRRQYLHQFGSRLEYCPVTLQEHRLLVRGRTDLCVSFMKRLYCFADEECKRKFSEDPFRYTASLPPRDIPPRLWVVGAPLSGKRTLASGLRGEFGAPSFHYERKFFEACIEAAQNPSGAVVKGIPIPHHAPDHPFVKRAAALLKEVRDFAEDQKKKLKLRADAEATMEARERKEEERAEREAAGEDVSDEEDEEEAYDEEKEAQLQEHLEFEPEDPEEAQERLTEAYLRMASCVTRFEPFESKGYVMVSPPFSEADLDILFEENCIPEAVVHLEVRPEVFEERRAAAAQQAETAKTGIASKGEDALAQEQHTREAMRETRRREKALRRWRRRHIGSEDPEEPSSADDAESSDGDADGAHGQTENVRGEHDGETDAAAAGADDDVTRADQLEALSEFLQAVADRRVPVFRPNANVQKASLLRATSTALSRHLANRLSFFYAVEVVEYDTALSMLKDGRLKLSSYAYTDPVELRDKRAGKRRNCVWPAAPANDDATTAFEGEPTLTQAKGQRKVSTDGERVDGDTGDEARSEDEEQDASSRPNGLLLDHAGDEEEEEEMSELDPDELEELKERLERQRRREGKKRAPRCGVLCERLYFFKDDENLGRFVANPLSYAECAPPVPPLPVRKPIVSLFADDDFYSGATGVTGYSDARVSLAEAVALNLGVVLVTEALLLTWAASQPHSLGPLAAQAVAAAMGCGATDDLMAALLIARLSSAEVKRRGALLLNLPKTVGQVDALDAAAPACPSIDAVVKAQSSNKDGENPLAWAAAVQDRIDATKLMVPRIRVPSPADPRDPANLTALVHDMDAVSRDEAQANFRRQRAFPIDLRNTNQSTHSILASLSPYQWYCPYEWVEESNLVAIDAQAIAYAAEYLGRCYVFSSEAYLSRFLVNPHEVADPSTLRELPQVLPQPVATEEAATATSLALKGCCPVILHDTRDRLGLRGVVEPVAKVGSRDFLVLCDGEYYACASEENRQRFLRRPWQYVSGAALPAPRKCPLVESADKQQEHEAERQVSDEDFMRRRLYDAVARAMIAVADTRPRYPGLTDEESALKFMALHMKAHHEGNSAVQQRQYEENFAVFQKRATLYSGMVTAAADETQAATFESLCGEYEEMQNGTHDVSVLGSLKKM